MQRVRLSARATCAALVALTAETGAWPAGPEAVPAAPPWTTWTASPAPIDAAALSPLERDALERCGEGEVGLRDVARGIAARRLLGLPMGDIEAIGRAQRAAGEPHPWPRAWVVSGRPLDGDAALRKLAAWLAAGAERNSPWLRCGVAASSAEDGTSALALVEVEALADLAPLPTRARPGEWLVVEALLRVRADGGQILVLGPSGDPRALLTSFDGTTLRARFAPERAGAFTVQVVADVLDGPRPVLEARVFADSEPGPDAVAAEPERVTELDDAANLARWLAAARASAGLPPLTRDPRLDAAAREHAVRMARTRRLAHDAGDGSPTERLRSKGLDPTVTGENVAHSSGVALAHHALWDSPSHRANILARTFDRVGVGVASDERGDAWAVEMFTGGP